MKDKIHNFSSDENNKKKRKSLKLFVETGIVNEYS